MAIRFRAPVMLTATIATASVVAVFSLAAIRTAGQAPAGRGAGAAGQAPAGRGAAAARVPRNAWDGKRNLNGIWQTLSGANWNLEDHAAGPGTFYQLGAIGAVPAGQSVVDGGEIPYLPAALAKRKQNYINRMTEDPEIKCYLRGIPRATYMPYPFQLVQSPSNILMAYEYASPNRGVNMGKATDAHDDTRLGW